MASKIFSTHQAATKGQPRPGLLPNFTLKRAVAPSIIYVILVRAEISRGKIKIRAKIPRIQIPSSDEISSSRDIIHYLAIKSQWLISSSRKIGRRYFDRQS